VKRRQPSLYPRATPVVVKRADGSIEEHPAQGRRQLKKTISNAERAESARFRRKAIADWEKCIDRR